MENDACGMLQYSIKGEKLDNNKILLEQNNILWRSNKTQEEMMMILEKIKNNVRKLASNLGIQEDLVQVFANPFQDCKNNKHDGCRHVVTKLLASGYKTNNDNLHAKQLSKRRISFLTHKMLTQKNISISKKINALLYKTAKATKENTQRNDEATHIAVNMNIFLCENKDWVREYRESIQPILCGNFYIRPSWHEQKSQYHNLIIDPSLSFGSGHHATTMMCIQMLHDMPLMNTRVLDVGCGSGILSLVCAKMGANVYACDTDGYACEQSKLNFKNNDLLYKDIWQGSINTIEEHNHLPKKYHLICANIVSSVIVMLKKHFIERLEENGILVLSGILCEHESKIIDNFSHLKLVEKVQIDEWLGFKFIKK